MLGAWIRSGTASSSAVVPPASARRSCSGGPGAARSSSTPASRATRRPTASAACSATTVARRPSCTRPAAPSSPPTRRSRSSTGEVVAASRGERRLRARRSPTARGTSPGASLLATGMDYRLPGRARRSPSAGARSVFHCPFCHGWEVRDRPLGVLDRGADGVHRALLLRAWSDDVTLLTDGPAELTDDEAATLARRRRRRRRAAAWRACDGPGDTLDGRRLRRRQRAAPSRACSCRSAAPALGAGRPARRGDRTARRRSPPTPSTSTCGCRPRCPDSPQRVTSAPMPSVANAIAAGSMAASGVVRSLVMDVWREHAEFWDDFYAGGDRWSGHANALARRRGRRVAPSATPSTSGAARAATPSGWRGTAGE